VTNVLLYFISNIYNLDYKPSEKRFYFLQNTPTKNSHKKSPTAVAIREFHSLETFYD
jgi:hypothetical protein